MKELYLWPINADQQGTPQQVRKVIDSIRENEIPVIFSESTVSDKPAKQVAAETGALYGGVLYVDSLSEKDGPVPTYLDLMKITTSTITAGFREGLKKMSETAPAIRLQNVSVSYHNGHAAIEDISFDLNGGTICGLVGVYGAGKSTLFKSIMGFIKPRTGKNSIM